MCLILFSYQQHPKYHLVLAANRDEYYDRPSAAAHFWEDSPQVLAGRDLQAGGTWLGISRGGRVAAITNYRGASLVSATAPSRGVLVRDFLQSDVSATQFAAQVEPQGHLYNGFNLLLKDDSELVYYSNRSDESAQRLKPGMFGLSNHLLNTPWPKVTRGCEQLTAALQQYGASPEALSEALLAVLEDRWSPPAESLPETGIPLARERILAPIFIQSESYGTRSSAVLLIDYKGQIKLTERTFPDAKTKHFELHTPF